MGFNKEKNCCDCVEAMAETLRQFQNHFAIIFEGNQASAFGVIREITNEKVLQYEQVVKILYTPSGNFTHSVDLMFISICDITEFIPFGPAPTAGGAFPDDMVSVINNLKQFSTIEITSSTT